MLLPSFVWFVLMNCAQQFLCSFNNSCWVIFLDIFYGAWLPPIWRALLVAAAFVLPHLNTVACVPLIERLGTYRVVRMLFHTRAIGAALAALVLGLAIGPTLLAGGAAWMAHAFGHHGPSGHGGGGISADTAALASVATTPTAAASAPLPPIALLVVGAFLVFNRVSTEAVCRLMNLCVADIVDEDQWQHRRRLKLSASVFGLQALLTKPFTSLAPMFGWWVLDHAGCKPASLLPAASLPREGIALTAAPEAASTEASLGSRLLAQFVDALAFDVSAPESASSSADSTGAAVELPSLAPALVWASVALLVLVPLALLGCQLAVWQRYPLHGARLRAIKGALEPAGLSDMISAEEEDDRQGRAVGSDPGSQELCGLRHSSSPPLQDVGQDGGAEAGRAFKEV
jgi:hypothetical protein